MATCVQLPTILPGRQDVSMSSAQERRQRRLERAEAFRQALKSHHARRPAGWQKELAGATGYTEQQISKIVSGARPATVDQMLAIAGALDAPQLLPAELVSMLKKGRATPVEQATPPRMSALRSSVPPTPIPASLRAYLDAHRDDLHPGVRWELEQNHDPRVPDYIEQDHAFWEKFARHWADVLGLASGPYLERGTKGGSAPGSRPR